MARDYYDILGISKKSSKEEIKKAYKKLAKQYHPDINKAPDAADKFKEINEAASVLGDDAKRAQYDQYGDADAFKQSSGYSGFDPRDFGFRNFGEDFDFGDIFDMFFGGGGSGFSRRGGRRDYSGSDLRFDMPLDLEEAGSGAEKTIILQRLEACGECNGMGAKNTSDIETCKNCGGSGRVTSTRRTPFGIFQTALSCEVCKGEGKVIKSACKACKGKGRVQKEAKIKINIPAGVEEGMRLRVSGEGDAGIRGHDKGDLYVVIHIRPHKYFIREGDDLQLDVPLSFTQAALGDTIEVPTLDGKTKVKIPAGTQTHTIYRLKGYGIPHLGRSGKGDLNVRVIVQVPLSLSGKQRDILEKFAKESGESASAGFFKKFFGKE